MISDLEGIWLMTDVGYRRVFIPNIGLVYTDVRSSCPNVQKERPLTKKGGPKTCLYCLWDTRAWKVASKP
jgi:hypothetical protein